MQREWRERVEKETGRAPEKLALPGGLRVDPLFSDLPPGPVDGAPGSWPYARGAFAEPSAPRSCPRIDPARPDAATLVEEAAELGARAFWVDGEPGPETAAAIGRVDGEIVSGLDPLGELVRSGPGPRPLEEAVSDAVRAAAGPGGPRLVASGLPYDEAGAGAARQLAFAVATGILYARRLGEMGLSTADAVDRIGFRLAAGADMICATRSVV